MLEAHHGQVRLHARRRRAGLTLVEMLVAMTCTILLMFAITQTFQNIGEVSARGRAAIEMSTQLRGVEQRLRQDLSSLTVPVRPWPDAASAEGYLEINEGPSYDAAFIDSPTRNVFGDFDDVIAMTVRSSGEPFVGRYVDPASGLPTMIQSSLAEVVWFVTVNDKEADNAIDLSTDTLNLHRRVLLIRPDLPVQNAAIPSFFQHNDISVRQTADGLLANTLGDLTQRENRFAHVVTQFPFALDTLAPNVVVPTDQNEEVTRNQISLVLNPSYKLTGDRIGEDVMLSNVLAADVRVFDRTAALLASEDGLEALAPGDPGYTEALTHTHPTIGYGAYVDLYYSRYNSAVSEFSVAPQAKSGLGTLAVYDTWSFWYERDGRDQVALPHVPSGDQDRATNGLDDNNANGVDDVGERETSPPYPVPLRGVQVRLRVLEPETRQVRQATVVQDFIPE